MSDTTTFENRRTSRFFSGFRGLWWRMWDAFLQRFWYVQPTTYWVVKLKPALCMQLLVTLAKPSVKRLEHRNLFANGRRYFFNVRDGQKSGFYMASTYKRLWSRQHRTKTATILLGEFTPLDDGLTRVVVQARMRMLYLLDVFPLPLFTASLIVFMPWHPATILSLIIALFALSWVAHRTRATLEAHIMTYFIDQAFEQHLQQSPALDAEGAHLIYENTYENTPAKFKQAWERFIHEHEHKS